MFGFLGRLFDTDGFTPRWECGDWSAVHGWTHILADTAIFGAYAAIPIVLVYFLYRRPDVPFQPILWLFAAFILSCGLGHLVEATIFWHPWYRFAAAVKVITAAVSWVTVVALIPMLPRALTLPGLASVNRQLEVEVGERRKAEEKFRLAVEAAPNAVVMINSEGLIALVNSQTEMYFGYRREELLGRPVEMLVPDRYRTAHPAYRQEFFHSPSTRSMGVGRELFGRRKDGSEFPVEIGLNPIETAEGLFVLSAIVDITARVQADLQREAANQRFRLAVESAPNAMIMVDQDGYIVLVNQQAEWQFGYSRDELVGQSVEWLVPERFRSNHPGYRASYFARPETRAMGVGRNLYARRKDGSEFPVEIGLNPIQSAEGLLVLSAIVDITERKQAEEALQESEAMFRSAFELTNVAMVLTDSQHRFFRLNEAFARMFGYTKDEMLAKSMPEITHPDDVARSLALREPLLTGKSQFFSMEKRYLHKDGRVLWGLSSVSLVRGLKGQPLLYFGQVQDITERKQAELAIVNYNQRLMILREIDRALIAGESSANIAAAALPQLRSLLGVRRVVVNLFDLVTGEVEWLAAAGMRRVRVGPGIRYSMQFMGNPEALRKGELQFIDVRSLPPGREADALLASEVYSYAVVPIISGDELIGALSFGGGVAEFSAAQLDIAREFAAQFAIALTQARLQERIRRQSQELEERVKLRTAELEAANKELEAFSYSVSHDLRAPLRAIDGFSRILLKEHAANLTAEASECLQDVRANTQKMGRLVDDLLAFSRLGRQPISKEQVSTVALVRQCFEELRSSYGDRQVKIVVADVPPCQADVSLLKQVWLNLLSNALKYSATRTDAIIEIGSQSDDESGEITYYVRDNGVGFDVRYASKLFGVFQRLHRSEEYEGTGVGLAIVQRIVHRHGGRVWAEAELGRGATFSFTLPTGAAGNDG